VTRHYVAADGLSVVLTCICGTAFTHKAKRPTPQDLRGALGKAIAEWTRHYYAETLAQEDARG
jgi:hypothetical protein